MPLVKAPAIDLRLTSTRGHTIRLAANEVRDIPDDLLQAAYMRGCAPVNANAPTPETRAEVEAPSDEMSLDDAVRMLVEEDDAEKLKADGIPKVAAVREFVPGANSFEIADAFARVAPETEAFRNKVLAE